ncbi:hypothetical protein PYCCODRAFT_1014611 [Trametes coccinea BRFM310]|uniref:Uncharacterized protein n=1 Tax=Trametes coccinea (strain BRFM310) TaxID=1353009 RepID=A0A1Y2IAU3_TRAC3|nr:hypothetical protein PYCCODRAFT_1014611 [Trametes coccinea BRFM310]
MASSKRQARVCGGLPRAAGSASASLPATFNFPIRGLAVHVVLRWFQRPHGASPCSIATHCEKYPAKGLIPSGNHTYEFRFNLQCMPKKISGSRPLSLTGRFATPLEYPEDPAK